MANCVYLSLGNEEEHVKNRAIKKVGDCIRTEYEILTNTIGPDHCALVWEEGNHFTDNEGRTARAFAWCLKRKSAGDVPEIVTSPASGNETRKNGRFRVDR